VGGAQWERGGGARFVLEACRKKNPAGNTDLKMKRIEKKKKQNRDVEKRDYVGGVQRRIRNSRRRGDRNNRRLHQVKIRGKSREFQNPKRGGEDNDQEILGE